MTYNDSKNVIKKGCGIILLRTFQFYVNNFNNKL